MVPRSHFPGSVKLVVNSHITARVNWAVAGPRQNSAPQFSTRHTAGGALPSLQSGQCGRFPLDRLPTSAGLGRGRWRACGHPSQGMGEERGQGWMQAKTRNKLSLFPMSNLVGQTKDYGAKAFHPHPRTKAARWIHTPSSLITDPTPARDGFLTSPTRWNGEQTEQPGSGRGARAPR